MKTKSPLSRVNSSLGALLAVALFGFQARPAAFDGTQVSLPADEEGTIQPAEVLDVEPTGAAIDTSSWDELSKQVLPRVVETNLDFGTLLRYAGKASCTVHMVVKTPQITMPELGGFTVPQGPPSTAQVRLSWEDADDDGTISEDEVKVQTVVTSDIMMKMAMDQVHKGLKSLVVLSVVNLLTQSSVKSEKKGEGYETTVNPKKGPPVPVRLTVSRDSRIIRTQTTALDGSDAVTNLRHARSGGKWLVTGAETTSGAREQPTSTDKSANEYQFQDGIPLLSKVTIVSTSSSPGGGVLQTQHEYSFRDWQIEKRAEPLTVVVEPAEPAETQAKRPTTPETPTQTPRTVVRPVEKAEAPKVRILRTEQANALAKDTILSVADAYYDIAAAGVKAYDASFSLELDGEPVGSVKLKWEAFGGVSIEPDLADDEGKEAMEAVSQQIAKMVSGGPLSDYSFAADVYATKTTKQTVIDATAHASAADPNVKSDLVYVSPDLRQVRKTRAMRSGETSETTYVGEEFEGKLFVRSATQTVREAGGAPEPTEYVWTYTKREGLPFVKRLEWSGTVGEETGDWTVALENVTFEREVARIKIDAGAQEAAKLAKEVKIPRTEETNKLARETLRAAGDAYHDLFRAGVSGYNAIFSVSVSGQSAGRFEIKQSVTDLTIEPKQVALEGGRKDFEALTKGVGAQIAKLLVGGPLFDYVIATDAHAIKSGDETTIDASEFASKLVDADISTAVIYVSADFHTLRVINVKKDGTASETVYNGTDVEGKLFLESQLYRRSTPSGASSRTEYTWTYEKQEGVPFIKKLVWKRMAGEEIGEWTVLLENVTFEKRTAQVPVEGGTVTLVPRTTEAMNLGMNVYSSLAARYYNLDTHTDVVAFEAAYSLEQNGKPIGAMNVSWDSRRRDTDVGRPPFPYRVARTQVTFTPSGAGPLGPRGETADEMKGQVELFGKTVFSIVAERTFPFAGMVYGRKEPLGTFIDVTDFYGLSNPFIGLSTTFVTEDLCLVSNITSMKNEETRRTNFEGDVREERLYINKVTHSTTTPGKDPQTQIYTFAYLEKEGIMFLGTALLEIAQGQRRASLKAELQEVHFIREKKTPEATKPDQTRRTTQPLVPDIPEDIQNAREQALKDPEERTRTALEEACANGNVPLAATSMIRKKATLKAMLNPAPRSKTWRMTGAARIAAVTKTISKRQADENR